MNKPALRFSTDILRLNRIGILLSKLVIADSGANLTRANYEKVHGQINPLLIRDNA